MALAADMQGPDAELEGGTLIAADTARVRLDELPRRAERAGAVIADTLLLNPGEEAEALAEWAGKADHVLIDAPCSGTGTWRRNPEARWRLTPHELERLTAIQSRLLDIGAALVKPGGQITYVTCSLLDEEGKGQFAAFLARHSGWRASLPDLPRGTAHGHGIRLTPAKDGTDGFFIARAEKA